MKTPDVLVLGGGGILGEAWISALLAGLSEDDDFDARDCGSYIGTSAGSIVAAFLCAGVDPRSRLDGLPEQPPAPEADPQSAGSPAHGVLRAGAAAGQVAAGTLASLLLLTTEPGGRLFRRLALGRVSAGRRSLDELGADVETSGVEWDGRLQISAVELGSGRRVMFDGSGVKISVAEAVQASCAIPGVFRPIVVDGRSYVDGGAWSPTNMDVTRAGKGDRVLCLNPTGSLRFSRRAPLGALGSFSRTAVAIEAAALRRRGVEVSVVAPDRDATAAMGVNLMSPSRKRQEKVLAAGLAQGRRLATV
jgi:NTE family protein